MFTFFAKLYDKKIDSTGLAVFRIAYMLVFICELCQMFYFRHLIFDRVPYLDLYEINLGFPLGVWIICCCLLLMGCFTKYMVWINYMFTLVFISTLTTYEYHVVFTYTGLNLLLLFLPISQQLSIDRLFLKLKYSNTRFQYNPPTQTTVLSYYIPIFIGIAFVYIDSILYKFECQFWLDGLGVWFPSAFPHLSIIETGSFAYWLNNNEIITKFLGYLTLVFETLFIFVFWIKRFRMPLFVVGLGLHLGILLFFPIPWFSLCFVALYLLLMPAGLWKKLGTLFNKNKSTSLDFYYDEECPLCARTVLTIKHFDIFSRVAFKGVQSHLEDEALKDIALEERLDNIYSVTPKGSVQFGVDTYIKVFYAMRYTFPIAILLSIPGIYHLAAKCYSYIASNREVERCTEDNCGYSIPDIPKNKDEIKLLKNLTFYTLRVSAIMWGILFCIALQLAVSYTSGVVKTARKAIGLEGTAIDRFATNISNKSASFGEAFLGITHHSVFTDYHFKEYNHIVAVSYIDPSGKETWLPIIDNTGSPSYYIYGMNWAKWTFRVNGPGKIFFGKFQKGISGFTSFWAHNNGLNLQDARFKLHLKVIDVPAGFEKDFLTKQRQKPWLDLGTAVWTKNSFAVEIKEEHHAFFRF